MLVNNVIAKATQQPKQLHGASRVVDVVLIVLAMASDVDDRARYSLLAKKRTDSNKIGLNSAIWRRKRPELKDSHRRSHGPIAGRIIGRTGPVVLSLKIRRGFLECGNVGRPYLSGRQRRA
jgi:hypothetical protein